MKLMTKELEDRFAKVGRQEEKGFDAVVVARYFHPASSWTWYATEYAAVDRTFFGYVCGFEDEWGYFSLEEMEDVKGPFGLGIERDLYFEEKPLRDVLQHDGHQVPR